MKKNNNFKVKMAKKLGSALLAFAIITMPNGCAPKVDQEITVDAQELEQIRQHDDKFGILVNKENAIREEEMRKIDLVKTTDVNGNEVYLQRDALNAFNKLKDAMAKENFEIGINTAFRTYEDQEVIYNELLNEHDKAYADSYTAPVGKSEHHTGLAIDVYFDRDTVFGKVVPLQFNSKYQRCKDRVYEIMAEYGFILRYPEGKEEITGYPEEAWHIRYVGTELAKFITEKGLTLEEYYEIINQYEAEIQQEAEMTE